MSITLTIQLYDYFLFQLHMSNVNLLVIFDFDIILREYLQPVSGSEFQSSKQQLFTESLLIILVLIIRSITTRISLSLLPLYRPL